MTLDTAHDLVDDFHPEVGTTSASSIYVAWSLTDDTLPQVQGFQVHYQKVASTYIQYSSMLPPESAGYSIVNLVADTYYKVCVVLYRNATLSPVRQCVDANTSGWHIPVSIGSSIGAILALSIIVLIVLLARCPSLIRQRQVASDASKYDSMSSHFPEDRYEMSDATTHGQDQEDRMLEHKVHVHTFSDGEFSLDRSHEHSLDRKLRPATDPLCNGIRDPGLWSHSGFRSQSQDRSLHHHHHHHGRHHQLQAMRAHHHSLMLEHHPIPQLTKTNSLDHGAQDHRSRPVFTKACSVDHTALDRHASPTLPQTCSVDEQIGPKDYEV